MNPKPPINFQLPPIRPFNEVAGSNLPLPSPREGGWLAAEPKPSPFEGRIAAPLGDDCWLRPGNRWITDDRSPPVCAPTRHTRSVRSAEILGALVRRIKAVAQLAAVGAAFLRWISGRG